MELDYAARRNLELTASQRTGEKKGSLLWVLDHTHTAMRTDPAELQRFAETVLNDPEVRSCPHGRPAVVYIEKQQLEKLFKRIV